MDRKRSRNREISDVLYQLKHQFGTEVQLYRVSVDALNRSTGDQTVTRSTIVFRKGIVFPVRDTMKFQQTISYLAANKNFTYGGSFNVGDREVILDYKDFPAGYTVDPNDYIVFDGYRYDIIDFIDLDFRKGVYFHLRRTQKEQPYQLISGLFVERLTLVEEFAATVN